MCPVGHPHGERLAFAGRCAYTVVEVESGESKLTITVPWGYTVIIESTKPCNALCKSLEGDTTTPGAGPLRLGINPFSLQFVFRIGILRSIMSQFPVMDVISPSTNFKDCMLARILRKSVDCC